MPISALNLLLLGVAQVRPRSWDHQQLFTHPGKIFAAPPLSGASAWGISLPPMRCSRPGIRKVAGTLPKLVGWAMATHLRTELVVDALQMAIWRKKPALGLIHHSDQGVQYTSLCFGKRLEEVGIVPSVGPCGLSLRQLSGGELRGDAKDRTRLPPPFYYHPRSGESGDL